MLELKSITWKNFLSYGDYETTLELAGLGQCLITGEVIESGESNVEVRRSNGAGKSTIPNVIQWVLFGRTMHSRSPGNNVVNYHTGRDCWARLDFKNGDSITRTRNTDGHNELIYYKDGDERRMNADTLATAALQQQQLNKDFGLDWELFCGSVFFNQYGKPWMEMADGARKKAIERILHVDRFTYYAQAAKDKCDNLDKIVIKLRSTNESLEAEVTRLTAELERVQSAHDTYESDKTNNVKRLEDDITADRKKHDEIELPDMAKLKLKWDLVAKIKQLIDDKRRELNKLTTEVAGKSGEQTSLESRIDLWNKKSGKICTACEQSVDCAHIDTRIDPLKQELETVKECLKELREKVDEAKSSITAAETLLKDKTPDMTMLDAQSKVNEKANIIKNIERLESQKEKIIAAENPHSVTINTLNESIDKAKKRIEATANELVRSELLNKHYSYVHKAYNDRNKIKSYVFKEHVPFINSRLKHYMDTFGLDVKVNLTDSLSIESNMWGYEFESGGERKRTDVAFMLAMFDFHEQMYGRQCNVLVLDEVDGRMDDDGIESLINIIKNDLASRVETVLIISHRNLMFDTFPRELRVTRRDRQSKLEVY